MDWPELPYEAWHETKDTLHMVIQIAGKIRAALLAFLESTYRAGTERGGWDDPALMPRVLARCCCVLFLALLCIASSSAPASAASIVRVTERDNGHTITLRRSQRLLVVLSSTYWQLQRSSNRRVLRLVDGPNVRPTMGCVPGAGCGTATATYLAAATGRATVTATRTSCGEAMRCTPAQSRFTLNIVVH